MSSLTLRRAIILALAPATLISQNATAATGDDLPVVELDPVVVTVSRIATPLSDTPASVTVISAGEIEKNPARNLSDVIQSDAGIYVKQSGGIGQIPEVSIRGSYPVHTLVLKDGARLNNQNHLGSVYTGFIDTTNLSRVEIAKGPASVQYGSDAIGGVIQMVSKTPTRTGAEITGVVGENNTYKAIVKGDVVHNDFYASLSGQRLETDGTRIFNNQSRDNQAGYEQKGYTAKLGFDNKQNLDASISFDHSEGINEFNNFGSSTSPNTSLREFENQIINAKISYKPIDNLSLNARYSNVKNKQDVIDYASFYHTQVDEADVNAKWSFANNQNILVGVTGNQSEYTSNAVKDGVQSIDTIGYYAQHQYNSDKVNTQVGVRLEDNERFGNHTVGQGAIRYRITPATSVYANVGSAFRAPALSELYYESIDGPYPNWVNPDILETYATIGNENLEPEKSISYELGASHQFSDNLTLDVTAFHTHVKNLIDIQNSTTDILDTTNPGIIQRFNTGTYSNIYKASFIGGEINATYVRDNYYAKAGYAYVETENKDNNREIAYRPKHTGTLTLGYDDGVVGVSTSIIARSDAYANRANTIKVPGYATVDVDAYWNINPNVKVFTNIQNIGNVEYKTANYSGNQWYVNGGRQANLGLTFKY
ncbi:TonB-dependent siderophore receptor [Moraxella sp. RCAD0137]|uniref:TonB-dependent receptor plug domain-containing protein n=1 Tax=Moraxella sp. RCAD0137 TaxID=1775913 RepID=UPI000C9FA2FB|nr:TonB-dependent receptor [Moraxella sp. RCAD0137]PNP97547.1 ligand-gated channel protein [Moraxella sp. RCAD0137]